MDDEVFVAAIGVVGVAVFLAVLTLELVSASEEATAPAAGAMQAVPSSQHADRSGHGPAWRALFDAVDDGGWPAPDLVLDAWLEREAERWSAPPAVVKHAFLRRVRDAVRALEEQDAVNDWQRIGELKRALLADRRLMYNRAASSLGHFLFERRLQCRSGSIAVALAWITIEGDRGPDGPRLVFVHTDGHLQPGLLAGRTLFILEATARDAAVRRLSLSGVDDMRIADAAGELTIMMLGEQAPDWLRKQTLLLDRAAANAEAAASDTDAAEEAVPFAFGEPEVPPGDLRIAEHTGEQPRVQTTYAATFHLMAGTTASLDSHRRVLSAGTLGVLAPLLADLLEGEVPPRSRRRTSTCRGSDLPDGAFSRHSRGQLRRLLARTGAPDWSQLLGRASANCLVVVERSVPGDRSSEAHRPRRFRFGSDGWRITGSGCAALLRPNATMCALPNLFDRSSFGTGGASGRERTQLSGDHHDRSM